MKYKDSILRVSSCTFLNLNFLFRNFQKLIQSSKSALIYICSIIIGQINIFRNWVFSTFFLNRYFAHCNFSLIKCVFFRYYYSSKSQFLEQLFLILNKLFEYLTLTDLISTEFYVLHLLWLLKCTYNCTY